MNNIRQFFLVGIIATVVFAACNQPTETTHKHQWGEWTVTTSSTCTEEGLETRVCTLDATHKETRPIAINPQAHDWGNWTQTTLPTYTTEGLETRTCSHDTTHIETREIAQLPFTSVAALDTWLTSQPANTTATAYTIILNIDDETDFTNLGTTLNAAPNKYVYLNLSGSTVITIPSATFYNCANLAGITIPNSVTSIGWAAFGICTSLTSVTIPDSVTSIDNFAFAGCTSLASVTFDATITSGNFGKWNQYTNEWNSPFDGNLLDKFYETDAAKGTPGTYTTTAPVSNASVWTKE